MNHSLPIATWRAQFAPPLPEPDANAAPGANDKTAGWRFADAAKLAPYLHNLGISHLYVSPVLEARAGSTHGYDVTDPSQIRGELGGPDAFLDLARRLREHNLGIILDIVPNHMAADSSNPWWWDVLTHGSQSRYARHFDIDWQIARGKVILPVLGKQLDEAISDGEIRLGPRSSDDDTTTIHYYDKRFPISPETPPTAADAPRNTARNPAQLRELLERQHYRLTFWRDGLKIINYRRFFDIADLVCIRVEDQHVFDDAHRLIFELLDQGHIRGLRIDHIDGLYNPRQYLQRLRTRLSKTTQPHTPYLIVEKILAEDEYLPDDWPIDGTSGYEFLSHINPLFIDPAGAAMIEADAHQRLSASPAFAAEARNSKRFVIRELFSAETQRLAETLAEIASLSGIPAQVEHLREALIETTAAMHIYRTYITDDNRSPQDHHRLTQALDAAAAWATESNAHWQLALPILRDILLSPPSNTLAPDSPQSKIHNPKPKIHTSFLHRWQQFTGPAMAKGVEDTALYRRITLASLNDVGCDPDDLPLDPVAAFHAFCIDRQQRSPNSLNTTSTHDTKRGEDTRLRISTLASLAPEYLTALDRWFEWHAPIRAALPGGPAPRPTDEVLIYQSLLGIWPAEDGSTALEPFAQRLSEYMIKAAREAKLRSSWHEPDEQYEEALGRFIAALVMGPEGERFREDSLPLRQPMMATAAVHSLAQVVIKSAAPGIPDFYRGTELWDLSLADPDNRRPVDFELRQSILAKLRRATERSMQEHMELLGQLLEGDGPLGWRVGAGKMFTIMRALRVRNQYSDVFQRGAYVPLSLKGAGAQRLIAFARRLDARWVLALVPRLVEPSTTVPLGDAWAEAVADLPDDAPRLWRNAMLPDDSEPVGANADRGAAQMPVAEVLRSFPVALLTPA